MSLGPPLTIPRRAVDGHKGTYGRVLLIGGSRGMAGSIAMSAIAALRTGSGLVSVAVPDRCLETVASFHPGIMTIPMPDDTAGRFAADAVGRLTTLVAESARSGIVIGVGPGMTTVDGARAIVADLVAAAVPRVFDADAINCLASDGLANDGLINDLRSTDRHPVVLTPHPGELARLVDVPADDRAGQIAAARELAARSGAVIVVKGGPSVVVCGDQVWTNRTGNPGMGTAGSGDVLTGVIASLLGQGLSGWDAARLGVWMHGAAGDAAAERYGQAGMTAVELLEQLPAAVQSVAQGI